MKHCAATRPAAICLTLLTSACADDRAPVGPQVQIQSSPLTLPGIENVCFGLTVYNGDPADTPDTVWSQPGVCSIQYGNNVGGDITYIGPCDADPNGRMNYVSLVLESVTVETNTLLDDQTTAPAGEQPDFQNPCPAGEPCVLPFPCRENEDTEVVFNLTVMRRAYQGYFDIAVNFDDIFCSAKVDTCYPGTNGGPGRPIELLFGYAADDAQAAGTLRRGHTAVVAVACTAGPNNANATHLYMTDFDVTCNDFDSNSDPVNVAGFSLDPSAGSGGNVFPTPGTFTSGSVWQYAVCV